MPKIIALLIIAAYLIYFILTPPLTTHDEEAHVAIIVSLAQGNYPYTGTGYSNKTNLLATERLKAGLNYVDHPDQIPTFDKISKLKANVGDYNAAKVVSHQAYSPPFYYLVGTFFYFLSKISSNLLEQFYILRLTSALFYIGTVLIAWKILLVFFKDKKTASSILLFFSINPLVLKSGIGINPDIGGAFFSLCFLYAILKLPANKLDTGKIVKISAISALAALTKISAIFTNAGFILYSLLVGKLSKKTFQRVLIFQAVFLAITFLWFIFAYNRFGTFFPEPFSALCGSIGPTSPASKTIDTFTAFRFTIMNYSGFMGMGWPHPFNWFFISYTLLFAIFLIPGFLFVLRQKKLIYKTLLIYIAPLILLILMISALSRLKETDCGLDGRFILPGFFVLYLFIYWGILSFTKSEEKAAKIVGYFAIFHYLFILFTVLIIRYYV